MNVTISDVMDIIHPERKKVVNELPTANSTNSTVAESNATDTNEVNKGVNSNEEPKAKSDL